MAKNSKGYGSIKQFPETDTHKRCCTCKTYVDKSNFHKNAFSCKPCANRKSRELHAKRMLDDPSYARQSSTRYRKNHYNLTADEYDSIWKTQEVCAICFTKLLGGTQTHLDHNHTTGKLRDFLCTNCNRGLGHFKDNIPNLSKAIAYLERHNNNDDVIKEGKCL